MSTAETGRSPLAAIGLDEQRWAANRLAGLDVAERRLYAHILRSFVDRNPETLDAVDPSRPGSGSGCSSACACPHINLFASPEAAERYLARPELHGTILTIPEATAAGRRLFGDLLDRLQETDAP